MRKIYLKFKYIYFTMYSLAEKQNPLHCFFVSFLSTTIEHQINVDFQRLSACRVVCPLLFYIINMNFTFFLLFLVVSVNSQVLKPIFLTLSELNQGNNTLDTFQTRAMHYLLQTHPELANYTVTKIHTKLDRGDQTYASNLKDFLFEMVANQKKIRALVTLSNDPKQTYVTLSPIVSSNPHGMNSKYKNFAEYSLFLDAGNRSKETINSSIMNQAIQSNNKNIKNWTTDLNNISQTKITPHDSYIEYSNADDPIVQFALDFVASEHPNIVNYDNKSISYQLVAGVNVKIIYFGDDLYTKVNAVVNFDLKLKPKIIRFEVDCIQNDGICNQMTAWSVYQSLESILIFHPQLFAYRIAKFTLKETSQDKNRLRVMIIFQNENKTRTVIDEQISPEKTTILSLYSYAYEQ